MLTAERLEEFINPKPSYVVANRDSRNPWLEMRDRLEALHQQEEQICLIAYLAELDLTADREYLRNHPEHLSEDEKRIIGNLINTQDFLAGQDAHLGGEACPHFLSLGAQEKRRVLLERLQALSRRRQEILLAKGGKVNGTATAKVRGRRPPCSEE